MKSNRIFGEIDGIVEGDSFKTRIELSECKLHRPIQAGISGSEYEGADSIVISGGYEDDEDLGEIIIYTGHGGRSNDSKSQVADQTLTKGNKALAISCEKQLPVRVIRGTTNQYTSSLEKKYTYAGLYYVTDYWHAIGKSGFTVWRFRLEKMLKDDIEPNVSPISVVEEPSSNYNPTTRKEYVARKIIRDTKNARFIKDLYNNACQICGLQIKTPVSIYSEAAHIKALGHPHNGPDTKENILCLCPNHHTMLDMGVISIDENFKVFGMLNTTLTVHPKHTVDKDFLKYHRDHHYKDHT